MTHPNDSRSNTHRLTRRTMLAGTAALAAGSFAPGAFASGAFASGAFASETFATARPVAEAINGDEGGWLGPREALDHMWSIIGREPCRCRPEFDRPCDWLGHAEIAVMWATGELTPIDERGTLWFDFCNARLAVAPAVVDRLAREAWVRRDEVSERSRGTCPPPHHRPGDLAALALADAIEFAADAAFQYVRHAFSGEGRSPAILCHPGLRAVRCAAPSPSRHHVPIDLVHELPEERDTVAGRVGLHARLVLGPGADR